MITPARSRFLSVLLLVAAAGAAGCRSKEAEAPAGRESPTTAAPERPASIREDPVAWLEARLAERPGDGLLIYTLARYAERQGDRERTVRWLEELDRGGWEGGLERSDFPGAASDPRFGPLAGRLDALERRVSRAVIERELDLPRLGPEGTAWDPKRRELLLSSGIRRTAVAIDGSGRARDVFHAGREGVFAVLGLEVDGARDRLWAATTVAPFMDGYREEDEGRSSLVSVDLATGEIAAVIEAPERPVMLNDLVVAGDGTIYVTDSAGGRLFRLAPGASTLEPLAIDGEWIGPNGIALAGDGRCLIVADFLGLWRFDPASGARVRVATPAGVGSLGGVDGLDRHGASWIAIQNVVGRGRVLRLDPDAAETRILSAEILEAGNPRFVNPTTGAVAGQDFLFLANPGAQTPSAGGEATAPEDRLVLLRVPLG